MSLDRKTAALLYWFWVRCAPDLPREVMPSAVRPSDSDIAFLRGHDLACWCPLDQPCHADVLLELANGGDPR